MSSNEIKIEKLVFGGQALAHHDGKTWFIWNALPGEVVECSVLKKRKGIVEAVATKIISASPDRVEPTENHWRSCSPWSILSPAAERIAKISVAAETFKKLSGDAVVVNPHELFEAGGRTGYRNKIEYSFTGARGAPPHLAFFNRGEHDLAALDECTLAHPHINEVAKIILAWVRQQGWTAYNLKSVIIRSNQNGDVIAGLFIKDHLPIATLPSRPNFWKGFQVFYSSHRSPASNPDELLAEDGTMELTEKIHDTVFKFGLFSFFQINIPVFLEALADIKKHIPPHSELLDFYSGVGTIGLSLASEVKKIILVESNPEAGDYAEQNIAHNKIPNAEAITAPAEEVPEYITSDRVVIVDPPRAGLAKSVVERLLDVKPPRIVYLSCGLDTQARDLALLAASYKPVFNRLYNFFPGTPHLESLVVLDLA